MNTVNILEHTSEYRASFLPYCRYLGQGRAVPLIFKVWLVALNFSVNIQEVYFSIAYWKELLTGVLCGVWCWNLSLSLACQTSPGRTSLNLEMLCRKFCLALRKELVWSLCVYTIHRKYTSTRLHLLLYKIYRLDLLSLSFVHEFVGGVIEELLFQVLRDLYLSIGECLLIK